MMSMTSDEQVSPALQAQGNQTPAPSQRPEAVQAVRDRNEYNDRRGAQNDQDSYRAYADGQERADSFLNTLKTGMKIAAMQANPNAMANTREMARRLGMAISEGNGLTAATPNLAEYMAASMDA